jgi:hypothetical protein
MAEDKALPPQATGGHPRQTDGPVVLDHWRQFGRRSPDTTLNRRSCRAPSPDVPLGVTPLEGVTKQAWHCEMGMAYHGLVASEADNLRNAALARVAFHISGRARHPVPVRLDLPFEPRFNFFAPIPDESVPKLDGPGQRVPPVPTLINRVLRPACQFGKFSNAHELRSAALLCHVSISHVDLVGKRYSTSMDNATSTV